MSAFDPKGKKAISAQIEVPLKVKLPKDVPKWFNNINPFKVLAIKFANKIEAFEVVWWLK